MISQKGKDTLIFPKTRESVSCQGGKKSNLCIIRLEGDVKEGKGEGLERIQSPRVLLYTCQVGKCLASNRSLEFPRWLVHSKVFALETTWLDDGREVGRDEYSIRSQKAAILDTQYTYTICVVDQRVEVFMYCSNMAASNKAAVFCCQEDEAARPISVPT